MLSTQGLIEDLHAAVHAGEAVVGAGVLATGRRPSPPEVTYG
ncbi:hypothetical protein SAMN05661080_03605 [Modestobacter sp. DSM 44400]|nr:hypothetical protein [Modestobacter sp. DSM 44400]SDY47981.1 hypothetical protein SAMN05661080_03605 [Modestobacter sp. DSM 44400]